MYYLVSLDSCSVFRLAGFYHINTNKSSFHFYPFFVCLSQHSQQHQIMFVCAVVGLLAAIAPIPAFGRSVGDNNGVPLMPTVIDVASALLDEAASPPTQLLGVLPLQHSETHRSSEQHAEMTDMSSSSSDMLSRLRRQSPNSDYYNNYYNDYYNSYYKKQQQDQEQQQQSQNYNDQQQYNRPPSADRFDGNGNSLETNNGFSSNGRPQTQVINGQKYTYTPLFQYKATKGHKEKLFVPNLFG